MLFPASQLEFEENEFIALDQYIREGGSAIFLGGSNFPKESRAGWNSFLSEHGIELESKSVIKNTHFKYLHPKEALITNGIVFKKLVSLIKNDDDKISGRNFDVDTQIDENSDGVNNYTGIKVIFPYGCTLKLSKGAIPLITSGSACYPVNSAIAAFTTIGKGKIITCGSWKMLEDNYLDCEDNLKIIDYFLKILINPEETKKLQKIAKGINEQQYNTMTIPNIEALSERLKVCIQESPNISQDFLNKFKIKLYESNFERLPESLELYNKLKVPYKSLKLIPPSYETPMLGLTPAVFPPVLLEIEPPKLELFDLDDEFANAE